jgi:hypothetical protein
MPLVIPLPCDVFQDRHLMLACLSGHAILPGMTEKRPLRPRDPNQLAKRIVDIATGEAQDADSLPASPDPLNDGWSARRS